MLTAVRAWILLSALLCSAGWILSAVHQLNRIGYLVVFAFAAIAVVYWRRKSAQPVSAGIRRSWFKLRRRFKRPAPLLFFALALLSLASGAFYSPANGDSMSYRIPRVFHWLSQEQWHWIRSYDSRMNIAGCGFEWLSAPLILFTRTDRCVFLINLVSYLMLPGLIFSVFTRLQVRPRVAWWWMWLLSSGWCFVMQASSIANDSFAVIYALAAVDFALRARRSRRMSDLWLSMLAVALLTGAKQTCIPLALLWLIAIWPGARLLLARPVATAALAGVCLLVSAVPLAFFNLAHTGTWIGLPRNLGPQSKQWGNTQLNSPFWGIVGNTFCLSAQNLKPPFFPFAGAWNRAMRRFLQTPMGTHFASFENFGFLSRGVSEGEAGIGLGICVLALASLWAMRRCAHTPPAGGVADSDRLLWWLRLTPWALLLLFMAKVGTYQNARQLAPYYVFLLPLLLVRPGQVAVVRRRWWQCLGLVVMLLTAGLVVVARNRPLFPAETIISWLETKYPDSNLVKRVRFSYGSRLAVESQRNAFREYLTPQEPVIGYASLLGGCEVGFWLPFGSRRVERVLADDTPEQLSRSGIHYVVVEDSALKMSDETIEQWMEHYDGDLVAQLQFPKAIDGPPGQLYLVRLRSKSEAKPATAHSRTSPASRLLMHELIACNPAPPTQPTCQPVS